MEKQYIIAGLGNPGPKYAQTRHNMGFLTIDRLAERHGIRVEKLKWRALIGEGRIAGQRVLLVKPQTYMNCSGESLREIVQFYKIDPSQLLVIYDDIDLPTGALRIRKFGSAGTHNGMRSVVYQLGSDRFPRIRIGIGQAARGDLMAHVIGRFTREEVPLLEQAVDQAADAVTCMLEEGIERAMNRYNTKRTAQAEEGAETKQEDAE